MDKTLILDLLHAHISQRPGLEFGNYGSHSAYRAELRTVGRQLREARTLLAAVESKSAITGEMLAAELSRGRLTLHTSLTGEVCLEFTACQYEPTEYRPAVSRVCSALLWAYVREQYPHLDGDGIRAHFRRWFGRGLASVWFN